jgi:hypothetical protein
MSGGKDMIDLTGSDSDSEGKDMIDLTGSHSEIEPGSGSDSDSVLDMTDRHMAEKLAQKEQSDSDRKAAQRTAAAVAHQNTTAARRAAQLAALRNVGGAGGPAPAPAPVRDAGQVELNRRVGEAAYNRLHAPKESEKK